VTNNYTRRFDVSQLDSKMLIGLLIIVIATCLIPLSIILNYSFYSLYGSQNFPNSTFIITIAAVICDIIKYLLHFGLFVLPAVSAISFHYGSLKLIPIYLILIVLIIISLAGAAGRFIMMDNERAAVSLERSTEFAELKAAKTRLLAEVNKYGKYSNVDISAIKNQMERFNAERKAFFGKTVKYCGGQTIGEATNNCGQVKPNWKTCYRKACGKQPTARFDEESAQGKRIYDSAIERLAENKAAIAKITTGGMKNEGGDTKIIRIFMYIIVLFLEFGPFALIRFGWYLFTKGGTTKFSFSRTTIDELNDMGLSALKSYEMGKTKEKVHNLVSLLEDQNKAADDDKLQGNIDSTINRLESIIHERNQPEVFALAQPTVPPQVPSLAEQGEVFVNSGGSVSARAKSFSKWILDHRANLERYANDKTLTGNKVEPLSYRTVRSVAQEQGISVGNAVIGQALSIAIDNGYINKDARGLCSFN